MTRVPLSIYDNLMYADGLRKKYRSYKLHEGIRKRIEEDDEGEDTVILDSIEMTAYLEATEDLGE